MAGRKYGNRKQEIDGYLFDSGLEARRYAELKLLEKGGEITYLQVHPKFPIVVNGQKICTYSADFEHWQAGKRVVEDCKGVRTPVYKLKKRLVKATLGIEIIEIEA